MKRFGFVVWSELESDYSYWANESRFMFYFFYIFIFFCSFHLVCLLLIVVVVVAILFLRVGILSHSGESVWFNNLFFRIVKETCHEYDVLSHSSFRLRFYYISIVCLSASILFTPFKVPCLFSDFSLFVYIYIALCVCVIFSLNKCVNLHTQNENQNCDGTQCVQNAGNIWNLNMNVFYAHSSTNSFWTMFITFLKLSQHL